MAKLKKGDSILHFEFEDVFGTPVNTKDLQGKKLLISFYRYAECIFCNLHIHQLLQKYPEWEKKGLVKIAFFQSPKEDILSTVAKRNDLPFHVISNQSRSIYKKYRVTESSALGFMKGSSQLGKLKEAHKLGLRVVVGKGSKSLIPADFLIDENGIIQDAFYGTDISEHISFERIEAFLA